LNFIFFYLLKRFIHCWPWIFSFQFLNLLQHFLRNHLAFILLFFIIKLDVINHFIIEASSPRVLS
jgi:hypothetical protein